MKTRVLLTMIFAITVFMGQAQEEQKSDSDEMRTIFQKDGDKKIDNGGYGAFTIGYSKIDGKDGMVIGGRAGWLINHRLTLGLVGYGFFNNLNKSQTTQASDYLLAGGYGGIFIEPIFFAKSPVHFTVPIIFGVGGVTAVADYATNNYYNNYYDINYYNSDVLLVFEPGVEVEISILKFFRIAVGSTYRVTNGINLDYYWEEYQGDELVSGTVPVSSNALDGFTFNLSFKFGWF